jgi:hypothetical protein
MRSQAPPGVAGGGTVIDLNAPAPWWIFPLPLVLAGGILSLLLGWDWWLTRRAQWD